MSLRSKDAPGLGYNPLADKHLAGFLTKPRIYTHLKKGGLITHSGEVVDPVTYGDRIRRQERRDQIKKEITKEIIDDVVEERRRLEATQQLLLQEELEAKRIEELRRRRAVGAHVNTKQQQKEELLRELGTRRILPEPREGAASSHSLAGGAVSPTSSLASSSTPLRITSAPSPTKSFTTEAMLRDIYSPSKSSGEQRPVTAAQRLAKSQEVVAKQRRADSARAHAQTNSLGFVANNSLSLNRRKMKQQGTSVSLQYTGSYALGPESRKPSSPPVEIIIKQQVGGGTAVEVFKGLIRVNEVFQFISKRKGEERFGATILVQGLQVLKLSTCCEFRHKPQAFLGAQTCGFKFVSAQGGSPCMKCMIEQFVQEQGDSPMTITPLRKTNTSSKPQAGGSASSPSTTSASMPPSARQHRAGARSASPTHIEEAPLHAMAMSKEDAEHEGEADEAEQGEQLSVKAERDDGAQEDSASANAGEDRSEDGKGSSASSTDFQDSGDREEFSRTSSQENHNARNDEEPRTFALPPQQQPQDYNYDFEESDSPLSNSFQSNSSELNQEVQRALEPAMAARRPSTGSASPSSALPVFPPHSSAVAPARLQSPPTATSPSRRHSDHVLDARKPSSPLAHHTASAVGLALQGTQMHPGSRSGSGHSSTHQSPTKTRQSPSSLHTSEAVASSASTPLAEAEHEQRIKAPTPLRRTNSGSTISASTKPVVTEATAILAALEQTITESGDALLVDGNKKALPAEMKAKGDPKRILPTEAKRRKPEPPSSPKPVGHELRARFRTLRGGSAAGARHDSPSGSGVASPRTSSPTSARPASASPSPRASTATPPVVDVPQAADETESEEGGSDAEGASSSTRSSSFSELKELLQSAPLPDGSAEVTKSEPQEPKENEEKSAAVVASDTTSRDGEGASDEDSVIIHEDAPTTPKHAESRQTPRVEEEEAKIEEAEPEEVKPEEPKFEAPEEVNLKAEEAEGTKPEEPKVEEVNLKAEEAEGTKPEEPKVEEVEHDEAKSKAPEEVVPTAEEVKPAVEEVEPAVEEVKPKAEEVVPRAEEVKPSVEEVKPKAEEAESKAEEVKPKAEEAKPKAEEAKPKAEEAKPKAEEAKPKAEEAKPKEQPTVEEARPNETPEAKIEDFGNDGEGLDEGSKADDRFLRRAKQQQEKRKKHLGLDDLPPVGGDAIKGPQTLASKKDVETFLSPSEHEQASAEQSLFDAPLSPRSTQKKSSAPSTKKPQKLDLSLSGLPPPAGVVSAPSKAAPGTLPKRSSMKGSRLFAMSKSALALDSGSNKVSFKDDVDVLFYTPSPEEYEGSVLEPSSVTGEEDDEPVVLKDLTPPTPPHTKVSGSDFDLSFFDELGLPAGDGAGSKPSSQRRARKSSVELHGSESKADKINRLLADLADF